MDIEEANKAAATRGTMRTIISCSRRTDVPTNYMEEYTEHFRNGEINIGRRTISLAPADVAAVYWWSKNYANLIAEFEESPEFWSQWKHMFQFTINSADTLIEPGVPSLADRFGQLTYLVSEFGPDAVELRFDPIYEYRPKNAERGSPWIDNLGDFSAIIEFAHSLGIERVHVALYIDYARAQKRGVDFRVYTPADAVAMYETRVMPTLAQFGVQLVLCACKERSVYESLVEKFGNTAVTTAACVDSAIIAKVYGIRASKAKDTGQREQCVCTKSVDIGSYRKCANGCKYCYGRP